MREILVYIGIGIISFAAILAFNYYTNKTKYAQCAKSGGEFYYIAGNANLSFCKIKAK